MHSIAFMIDLNFYKMHFVVSLFEMHWFLVSLQLKLVVVTLLQNFPYIKFYSSSCILSLDNLNLFT